MSKSAQIVLTVPARGVFHEGTLSGTIFPGMCAEVTSDPPVGGRPFWQAYSGTTAARALLAICTVAGSGGLQGRAKDDEYADGERVFIYCPNPGDHMNLRVDSPVGTGTPAAIEPGDLLALQSGGMFAVTSTPAEAVAVVSEVFEDDAEEGGINGTVQVIIIGAN